jgi:hypothetical protein
MTTADQTRPSTAENNFDADGMREKYRRERDKRIRADGNDQYIEVTGDFAHFVDDPYVQAGYEREPVLDDVDVLLIGGGFGGLERVCARRVLRISASLKKEVTSVAPGTGTVTREPSATRSPMSTCRWDYDYTGGDADGGLDRLQGKRIAIIGTGASAPAFTMSSCKPLTGTTLAW